jgi:uncharacterized protein YjiK
MKTNPFRLKGSALVSIICSMLLISTMSCFAQRRGDNNGFGYDLKHPKVYELKDQLREISDLSYSPSTNSVYAICDNSGDLFEISVNNPDKVQKWKFHKSKDFEAVAIVRDRFYVLNSDGDIYETWFKNGEKMKEEKYPFPYGKGNEFEILYYDSRKDKLIIICKDCVDDGKKQLSTYSFDPRSHQYSRDPFTIRTEKIAAYLDKTKVRFKPSAAAIHPITGELYIVSSINKVLVVADRNGVVREVHHLDPNLYKQPEGITFTSGGDMLISNEYHKEGQATLLYFPYKNGRNETPR